MNQESALNLQSGPKRSSSISFPFPSPNPKAIFHWQRTWNRNRLNKHSTRIGSDLSNQQQATFVLLRLTSQITLIQRNFLQFPHKQSFKWQAKWGSAWGIGLFSLAFHGHVLPVTIPEYSTYWHVCYLLMSCSVKKKLEYIQLYVPFRSEASISSCNLEIKGESNCKQYTKSAGFLNSDFFSSPQESIITGECFKFYFSIFIEHLLCAWHCSRNWVCRNKLKKGTVLMGSYSNDTFKQLWSTWTREKRMYTWFTCCTPESNTTLLVSYTPIKCFKKYWTMEKTQSIINVHL